jgi:hypothetical protein
VRTIDGARFDFQLDPAPRKLTALVFLSPWCESYLASTRPEVSANCRSARAQFSELAQDPRVRWPGCIGLGDKGRPQNGDPSLPWTHRAQSSARVNDVPTVLIADPGGRIVRRLEGNAVADGAVLRQALAP